MVSNLLLSYFSQSGTNGPEYAEWILGQVTLLYDSFSSTFLSLWGKRVASGGAGNGEKGTGGGELFKGDLFNSSSAGQAAQVQCSAGQYSVCAQLSDSLTD